MKMKKNILSIVISILSACILCVNLSVTATAGYTSDYVYNILETTAEKEFYNSLYQSCKEVDESDEYYTQTPYVENNYNLSHEHVLEIIHMFTYDHPEFFWLSNSTMFSSWYGYSLLILEDFYDGSDRQNAKNEIFAEIQTYIDGAKQCSTDYDKVKFFHDKLLQNVSYQEGDRLSIISTDILIKTTARQSLFRLRVLHQPQARTAKKL